MNENQKQMHADWLDRVAKFEEFAIGELKTWGRYGLHDSAVSQIPGLYDDLMGDPVAFEERGEWTVTSPTARPLQEKWEGLVEAIRMLVLSAKIAAAVRDRILKEVAP